MVPSILVFAALELMTRMHKRSRRTLSSVHQLAVALEGELGAATSAYNAPWIR